MKALEKARIALREHLLNLNEEEVSELRKELDNNRNLTLTPTKEEQRKLLSEITKADEKDGIYDVDAKEEWISVEDRLPSKYCQVLVYCPQSFPKNCRFLSANYYDDNKKFYGDSDETVHEDVTHWMEIKEPF
jgi:hypothetical protein